MMLKRDARNEEGFTLVELLVSMAFFSFVLLFVITGFIQINRSYTRGVTVKEIQNTARELIETLTLAIRDADANTIEVYDTLPGNLRVCAGGVRFAWNMPNGVGAFSTEQYDDVALPFGMARTTAGACTDVVNRGAPGSDGTQDLLEDDIVIQHLSVDRIGATSSFRITLVVSTDVRVNPGDFTQTGIDATCDIKTGDQFCDVARIDTVVSARN